MPSRVQSRDARLRALTVSGVLALAVAAVGIVGLLMTGGPYSVVTSTTGTVAEVVIACTAVLTAALATVTSAQAGRLAPGAWIPAVASAWLGAAVAVTGTALSLSGEIHWFRAGVIHAVGWALLAPWFAAIARGTGEETRPFWLTANQRLTARLIAGLLAVGLLGLPLVISGADPWNAVGPWIEAPWHAWLALGAAGLTAQIAVPLWQLVFGYLLVRRVRHER